MRSLQRFVQKLSVRRQPVSPLSSPPSGKRRHRWRSPSWQAPWRSLLPYPAPQQLHGLLERLQHPPTWQPKLSGRPVWGIADQRHEHLYRVVAIALVVLCLTGVIGYRFYSKPLLTVGAVAPQTLRAPAFASVVDRYTTEANRRAVQEETVPVLQIEPTVNQQIYQTLQDWLEAADSLRQQAGALPYVATATLSTPTQRYLRQSPPPEWQEILRRIQPETTPTPSPAAPVSPSSEALPQSLNQVALLELQSYRRLVSVEDFSALQQTVERARRNYAAALGQLSAATSGPLALLYSPALLDFTDAEWEQTKATIRQALERILTQGIAPGLPSQIQENAIRVQVGTSAPGRELAIAVLQAVIRPNLVTDPQQTILQAQQAARRVQPVTVEIRRGETIVTAGGHITQSDFVLLDHFGMSQRQIRWLELSAFAALMVTAVVLFLQVQQRFHPDFRRRDYLLVLLLTLTAPLLLKLDTLLLRSLGLPTTSLLAIGLLLGGFYGGIVGATVVLLLSLALAIGMGISLPLLISGGAAGLMAALLAGKMRSREELALLGGAVGLAQGMVYLLVGLLLGIPSQPFWQTVFWAALQQGIWGMVWSVAALGISPYLEQVFDLITPIRLAELSNPNRPLLKRLAAEAPGTFQHTLFVATLAEAAARELHCNVELVRAGTLYHDIGKMHDPLGFIENQMGGANKHDLIDDPWKSAEIIRKHVTEGVVMAKRYRLPRAIQAFIPEHQGTMEISYFFHEAKKRAQADPTLVVQEADFRYEGPAPQSRETGIVMLADSCEAALRSLQDATPEEALAMVNRVLRARWQDNQLVNSGLSRDDMTAIAEVFVQVWRQFNHKRIAYPKLTPAPQPAIATLRKGPC